MSIAPTPPDAGGHPSPERIMQAMLAFQQSAALRAGLDLEIFTAIGAGAHSVAAIAEASNASPRGIRILCDYLSILGFLVKSQGEYSLSGDSAMFLDSSSQSYLGGVRHFLQGPMITASFQDLTSVVRKGTTSLPDGGSVSPQHPEWVEFARSMTAMMVPSAKMIANLLAPDAPRRVLDIAAGHGLFGIEIARRCPEAHITAVDWPGVLAVAQENAQAAGIDQRYATLAGDAFKVDFGSGYDVVLLTNFLHHFDSATCVELLRKVHAALAPRGRCVTLEFVPNSDRVSPAMPAAFSLMMLATTSSGDAYTFEEFERMFQSAGFTQNELIVPPVGAEAVILSQRD